MRKNTKRLIALLMTITMILAVCPVEIFAWGKTAAVSTAPASASNSADTAEDTLVAHEASVSEDASVTESEAPVSDEQSEATAPQETSGNATALQKSSGLLPAPVLRYQKSSAAAAYIVTAVFEGEGTAEQPYLIGSSADWDALSSAINSGSTAYAGKYFKLTDDITVTTMLGYRPGNTDNDDYVFSGTFDGGGHTLNVNINTSLGFAAPFAIAHNAVIKNLKVTGTVTSTGYHATGLVGASKAKVNADESSLTIQNVTVSTDVSCTSHIAGIIGHAHQANITMENVVFDGSLNASSVQGGFIGWGGAIHGFNATFKDCLFAGTYKSGAAFYPIAFASGQGTTTLINDFYTTSFGSGGSPIAPTGSGTLKILAAAVENQGETHYFDDITTAASSENWVAGSTLKLMSDIAAASTITVPAGSHTLDLNGHTVKAASAGYSVITVGSGAALVVDDTASGGKITGGSVGQNYGGGITVDAGTLTLRGGAVSGNANTHGAIGYCGGGVLVKNSGKFYMEGGEISGNTSYVGGGVCCDTSATTVIITGGEIKNNKITRFGSGVLAGRSSSATFKIGGDAKIVDNISTWTSDKNGEASVNFSKLSISGNPTVRGCWKTTGNSAPNAHINLDNNGSSVQRVTLDGALTNESGTPNLLFSPIYRWNDLQSGKTFVFTENWSTYMGTAHPADYFGVDASVSGVRIIRKDGEAAFTGSGDLGDLYITYDANGGSGEMDAQLVSTTSAVLNQNSFTNGSKEFIGWNTKADGSGTPYGDKGDITLSGDVTLYAQWAEKHAHDDVTFTKWEQTSSLPTKAGDYYLGADVTISSTWNVPTGTVNLCLNGHGIKMTGSGTVINVVNGADFTLCDCGENEHRFSVSSPAPNGAGLAVVDDTLTSGYKTFTGGYITGGNARNGGGIKVNGTANLVMNGGTVIGNQSSFMGAGIKADNNGDNTNINITVNGGAIIYNTVNGYGAGICSDGAVRVNGGTIAYNYATKDPGGIHCHYLYLSGGSIVNNYADDNEYSAGVHADHEVFISGNPVISDNVYKGTPYNLDWDRTELAHGHKLNITGALSEDTQISVTLKVGGTGVFTNGWKANMGDADPAKYFTSDNRNYSVSLNQDGEAEIGVPPVASIISGETTTSYGAFDAAVSAWLNSSDGATLKLLKDVSYTDKIILSNSKKLVLDLNGKTYTRAVPSGDGTVFDVNSGANFTLTDTSEEQTGVVTRQSGNFGGTVLFVRDSGSVINYDGGKLTGFTSRVIISWQGSTVNMSGGEISGNNLINGDATDGIVRTYSSTSEPGGTFNMTGGKIINNTLDSGKTGGAVYVGNNGMFNISGNVEISGNTQDGKPKNVYLPTGTTMNDTGALGEDALICVTLQNGTGVITNGWKANMGEADPTKYFTSDNADYTVILKDGEVALEYPPVPDVSASGYTGDYDGAAHSIAVSVPTGATVQYGTKAGDYSLTENPSYTNAGTYNVYYKVTMDKHTPVEGSAVVTINQIDVTVTITGHNITVNYDGKAHSADGYDFAADTTLYTAADFTFSGRAEAVRTDAGTATMGLAASQFANTNDNFDTVTFNVSDGFVKINPIDVTVTITGHSETANYDGKA
ncbi:MAG: hypothetical protein E7517_04700, partial [Ruminococcaceae bacterium]|nr:hypothetical protein [Oscillospiraceae bacterium]